MHDIRYVLYGADEVPILQKMLYKSGFVIPILVIPKVFNLICIHVLLLMQIFWDPKNVNFHLMYLKHGSITLANMILR